jgi:zinc transport system ATP-binding protein
VDEFLGLRRGAWGRIPALLGAVGLDPALRAQQVGVLSSGQFQRVLMAWALGRDPDVLLLDEPMAGVDVGGEATLYTLLSQLHAERGLTLLLVTHDLGAVHRLSTTVLWLNRRVVGVGPPTSALSAQAVRALYGGDVRFPPPKAPPKGAGRS